MTLVGKPETGVSLKEGVGSTIHLLFEKYFRIDLAVSIYFQVVIIRLKIVCIIFA